MVAAIDRLEREISASGFLVGDSFTLADLTAAALFYGVACPSEFPYAMVADRDLPESWREFLDSLAQRPGGRIGSLIFDHADYDPDGGASEFVDAVPGRRC
jgi:glutathione S-transferase